MSAQISEDPWSSAGLTARQAHTQAHIARCPNCGAWIVATTRHGGQRPATCEHLNPDQPKKGQAA